MSEDWIDWSPPNAPHVKGRYTRRVFDEAAGMHEEQRVEARCEHPGCGGYWKGGCSSGRVREHIATFAVVHLHRDPLEPRPPNTGVR